MTTSTNRRVLITGASSGIGKETALTFAKAGYDLILVARSMEKLQAIADEAQSYGVQATVHTLDLAQVEQVKSQVQALMAHNGFIDILVNSAGMGYTQPLAETPLNDWQRVIDLNLTSVFQCIQAVLPSMRDRGQGVIINVASVAAHSAFPDWGAYSVSKAGLVSLSRILSAEERGNGIRVITITPGAVNTPIWDTDTVQADFDRSSMLTPDIVANSIVHAATLPQHAVIEELTLMPSGGAL
ncbi:MAG: SDR family oxidoreductase [Cyanobacteria bacterium P01_A01_bin.123]